MKIVREVLCEDRENEFSANHALAGDKSGFQAEQACETQAREKAQVHSEAR
jgi:hypothetical protein